MPMYDPFEYSSNYSETTRSLWFYSRDEATNFNADIAYNNHFESVQYKAKLLGNTVTDGGNGILRNAAVVVLLKYLSSFWNSLEMPLINCNFELKVKWTKYCVFSAAGAVNTVANADNIIFTVKNAKLNDPVATLSARDNRKSIKNS